MVLGAKVKIKTLNEFLGEPISEDELEYLKAKEKQKIYKKDNKIEINQSKEFLEYFYETDTKIKRDLAILSAYKDGYTQVKIATHLKLSTSMISKIIKSGYSITGV